jgi:WD40 repeat protein
MQSRYTFAACCLGLSSLLLGACATAPPETDDRLGTRRYTECSAVDVAPDGKQFAALCDVLVREGFIESDFNRTLEIVGVSDGKIVNKTIVGAFQGIGPSPWRFRADIAYSPDGSLLAVATGTGYLAFYAADSLSEVAFNSDQAQEYAATAVAFSPDGRYVAVGFGGFVPERISYISVFDVDARQESARVDVDTDYPIVSLVFSPDSTVLAATTYRNASGHALLLDWRNSVVLTSIRHDQLISAIAFRGGGSQLLTLSDDLKIFRLSPDDVAASNISTAETVATLGAPPLDRSALVTPGIWELENAEAKTLELPFKVLQRMALSPDEKLIAFTDAPNRVNIVDFEGLELQCRLFLGDSVVAANAGRPPIALNRPYPDDVAWVPDGQSVVVASKGLHVFRAGDLYGTARLEALESDVNVPAAIAESVASEMRRAFFESRLFDEGDELVVRYRILEFEKGSQMARFLVGAGNASMRMAVEFVDRDGTPLWNMVAEGKTNIFKPDEGDSFGELMSVSAHLAWRRTAEAAAEEAARRYSCYGDIS